MIKYRRDLWQLLAGPLAKYGAAEVGVAEGYFSAEMLNWPIVLPVVYMVDRWKTTPSQRGDASNAQEWHNANFNAAVRRVYAYGDRAIILRGDSVEMAHKVGNQSLSLVYIDGDHSYQGVMEDIQAWLPKLVPGGYMAFHDYENVNYGVKQAVNDFCSRRDYPIIPIPEDKPEDAGAYFQYVNSF